MSEEILEQQSEELEEEQQAVAESSDEEIQEKAQVKEDEGEEEESDEEEEEEVEEALEIPKTKAGMVKAIYDQINSMKKSELSDSFGKIMGSTLAEEEESNEVGEELEMKEVKKLSNSSFLMKMRKSILPDDASKGSHIDASIIGNQVKNNEISNLVSKIGNDPKASAERVKLVRSVMRIKQEYPLSLYRNLMIQASLTIYLGDIAPATLQIAGQTYRLYLEKIINIHKKNLVVIRSDQLKNVNMDLISIEDLVKILTMLDHLENFEKILTKLDHLIGKP